MHPFLIATILGASLGQVLAQDGPSQDKTPLFTDGGIAMDPGLNKIPFPVPTVIPLPAGPVPQECLDINDGDLGLRCALTDFEVYHVTYPDCPVPQVFCRCKSSATPILQLAQDFGRIPLHARESVGVFAATRAGAGCAGASNGVDFWVDGTCFDRVSVYMHEVSHVLDYNDTTRIWQSTQPKWRSAVDSDRCIVDEYSRKNWLENFAQVGVLIAYDYNVASVINTFPNTTCMLNQLIEGFNVLHSYFKPSEQPAQCTQAVRQGPMVCASEELRAAGKCDNLEDTRVSEADYPGVTFRDAVRSDEIVSSKYY